MVSYIELLWLDVMNVEYFGNSFSFVQCILIIQRYFNYKKKTQPVISNRKDLKPSSWLKFCAFFVLNYLF